MELQENAGEEKMIAVKYWMGMGVYLENRDPEGLHSDGNSWAITRGGNCINRKLKEEYEPMPSRRGDKFLKRCRYTLEEAKVVAEKYVEKLKNEEKVY